ncbi:acid-sensing ion channel 4-A-like [Magallana gigas]|uniref:acid-sensing ion channel 4-A-like n=1 Tax=Magallana gigas TaxID=29159 RepID=UPI00333E69B6
MDNEMKTTVDKPSTNRLNRVGTINEQTDTSVSQVTGVEKTYLPSPEVVLDVCNDVDLKGKKVDNDNIQVLWSDYRDNTTMHGLKNMNLKQRHRLRCCIWAAALIVMGSCLIYTSYKQVKNYLSYPTIINTQVQTKTSVKFPAITFCSASPLKNETLPKIPDLEYFFLYQSALVGNAEPRNLSYSEYHVPINASWVIIHDQNDEPDVIDKGFFVSPGFSTFASIQKMEYRYLPSPYKIYGNQFCVDTKSPDYRNPLQYYDVYSKTACMRECKQDHVFQLCGCRTPYDKERFDQNGSAQEQCICPTECEYDEYQAGLSTGYFPAKNYQTVLNEMGITDIRETYLELAIYFESLDVLNVEQKPEYSFEDIIGLLGGQMGLFLGASLLTLTELIEVILLSSLVVGRKLYHRIVKRQ